MILLLAGLIQQCPKNAAVQNGNLQLSSNGPVVFGL